MKQLFTTALLLCLSAFHTSLYAVHQSPNHIGQLLLAPIYMATEDWKTKVSITNTRVDTAVKTKVVLRASQDSHQVYSFLCYMSPADVCHFEVRHQNGTLQLYSEDNSIHLDNGEFASAEQPWVKPIDETGWMGHLEVIGVYGVRGDLFTAFNVRPETEESLHANEVQVFRGMTSSKLAAIFDTPRAKLVDLNGHREEPHLEVAEWGQIRSTDPSWVKLLGSVSVERTDTRHVARYLMTALAGAVGDNIPSEAENTQGLHYDGRVISNPDFDVTLEQETPLGLNFGMRNPESTRQVYDNLRELENALAVSFLRTAYEDERFADGAHRTHLILTFPTRYRHRHDVCELGISVEQGAYYPPFNAQGGMEFHYTFYELHGYSVARAGSFLPEPQFYFDFSVNYYVPDWPNGTLFKQGWAHLYLEPTEPAPALNPQRNDCGYQGIPALGLKHQYVVQDGGIQQGNLLPLSGNRTSYWR